MFYFARKLSQRTWTLLRYAPGFLLSKLVGNLQKILSVTKRYVFFSKRNLLDVWHGLDKLWLVMNNFEQTFLIFDLFFLGFYPIETGDESTVRLSFVGDIGFCLAKWCAQCMTTCCRRHHPDCFNQKHLWFWDHSLDSSN